MCRYIFFFIAIVFWSCTATTNYYIVRHAEKETVTDTLIKSSSVPLSQQGVKRAESLRELLKDKEIKYIFSTNTVRTKATAQPLSDAIKIPIEIYNGGDSSFVQHLKELNGNVLVVGHTNTVDDIVNGLTGKTLLKDLPETQYGDLFIVRKKGNDFTLEKTHY